MVRAHGNNRCTMRIALLTFILLAGLGVAAGNFAPQPDAVALSRIVGTAG